MDNTVMVAGAVTVTEKIDCETVVRGVVRNVGFDPFIDDLSSVDSKGLNFQDCEVLVRINKQSPEIAGGVHVCKDDFNVDAGDQGIMFGYASDETEDATLLTHSMVTRLAKKLNDVRKNVALWWCARSRVLTLQAVVHVGKEVFCVDVDGPDIMFRYASLVEEEMDRRAQEWCDR